MVMLKAKITALYLLGTSRHYRKPRKGAKTMTKHIINAEYYDCYEYHGNTTIELTRKQGEITVWRDWISFDTVQEATDYFNERCGANEYVGS